MKMATKNENKKYNFSKHFFIYAIDCEDGKPKIFSSRSKLHRHLLSHQAKERQIRCKKCSALFHTTLAEITHNCRQGQRVLSNSFHCPICQYNCNKAVALKSHMLTHQTPPQKNSFFCPYCRTFTCARRSELSRHIERKHKGTYVHLFIYLRVSKKKTRLNI